MFISKPKLKIINEKLKQEAIENYRQEVFSGKEDGELKQAIYYDDLKKENEELKEKLKNQSMILGSFTIVKEFFKK